jgi:hypothetical protein
MKQLMPKAIVIAVIALAAFFIPEASAQNFHVIETHPDWQAEGFFDLPFRSAAIAFDSHNNLYANDLVADFSDQYYEILSLSAVDNYSGDPVIYVAFEATLELISGLDFDENDNLYVSEVVGMNNDMGYEYHDAGQIIKIYRDTHEASEPILFLNFRPTGIATVGDFGVIFPGRKWSDPNFGNIYQIPDFENFFTEPTIILEDAVLTAIATNQWGTVFGAPRFNQSGYDWLEWPVFARNPYTDEMELIAKFNKLIEELTFDADGNLFALEQTDSGIPESEIIKLIPPTVNINGCDTGIIDWVMNDGYKLSTYISEETTVCSDTVLHGDYVSCIAESAIQMKRDGVITGKQMGAIVSCAAKSDDY